MTRFLIRKYTSASATNEAPFFLFSFFFNAAASFCFADLSYISPFCQSNLLSHASPSTLRPLLIVFSSLYFSFCFSISCHFLKSPHLLIFFIYFLSPLFFFSSCFTFLYLFFSVFYYSLLFICIITFIFLFFLSYFSFLLFNLNFRSFDFFSFFFFSVSTHLTYRHSFQVPSPQHRSTNAIFDALWPRMLYDVGLN